MGKKKGGKDKGKAKEDKKKKQEQKAQKKAGKKKAGKGDGGADSEDDLDAILNEIAAKDAERTVVTVESDAPQPTPRANFSLCPLEGSSSGELLLFGGELYDGNSSDCFNDLYRLNLDKLEWKKISSPNTPGPRNAHQTVVVRDTAYVFGGEFSRGFQFRHYRDLWKLDLNKNAWTQFELKTGPSPRSGHRMVLWKHYLVLFGGFYETSRGVKFYEDLYFFDLREEKWIQAIPSKTSQWPSARSGFQMVCHASRNTVFVYGGYSKVSVSTNTERGRNLDDMWALHLTAPAKAGECPGFRWESVPKKGAAPSRRSGASSCVHKNRLILFGGVTDKETSNDVEGEFHNTLHAFDMERLKWFALKVSAKSAKADKSRRRKDRSGQSVATSEACQSVTDDDDDDNDDDDDDDDGKDDFGLDDNAFYVYIDGKLTKIEYEDDDEAAEEAPGEAEAAASETDTVKAADSQVAEPPKAPVEASAPAPSEEVEGDDEPMAPVPPPSDGAGDDAAEKGEAAAAAVDEEGATGAEEGAKAEQQPATAIAAPRPRIGAGLGTLGSKLFVFAGTTEVGDQQITFDDLWCVDLNQMDKWTCLVEGTWQSADWKGEDEDEDDDEDEEDDGEDGEDGEDDEDDEDEETIADAENDEALERARMAKLAGLREKLQVSDDSRTPRVRETLRDFFRRTMDVWTRQAFENRDKEERLTGKEVRRLAFQHAAARFRDLLPVLEELDRLEEEQTLAEELQEQEKQRFRDKVKSKLKKRKAHMAKAAKKQAGEEEDAESDSEDDE